MTDNFYIDFEKEFRGSPELIRERLAIYLPYIESLKNLKEVSKALDMGCGRGEWIEILSENGFSPKGFDLNDRMIAYCGERGLDVEKVDVLEGLKRTASNSQAIVTAFHLVEHLSFDRLREVVSESLRVLMPGGLLILETPNPENLMVATLSFYLDPTHIKPIPPMLLSFICEYAGFSSIEILRMGTVGEEPIGMLDILGLSGINQDYAVIAQKGSVLASDHTRDALAKRINLQNPMHPLVSLWTSRIKIANDVYEQRLLNVEERLSSAESRLNLILSSPFWRLSESFRYATQAIKRIISSVDK